MVIQHKRFRFSEKERERVRLAVEAAEKSTTGEIVPWIVPTCKSYRWVHGVLTLGGLSAATAALAGFHWERLWEVTLLRTIEWQLAGALVGLSLSFVPAVKRALVPRAWMAEEAHVRSLAGFVAARLTETRDRNGVLIFIALFERRVHILADKGVDGIVPQGYWDERVREVVDGVHEGKPIEALCHCVAEIGRVLTERFPATQGRTNQLSDELRE